MFDSPCGAILLNEGYASPCRPFCVVNCMLNYTFIWSTLCDLCICNCKNISSVYKYLDLYIIPLYYTVYTLWQVPDILKFVYTWRPVYEKMMGGAGILNVVTTQ